MLRVAASCQTWSCLLKRQPQQRKAKYVAAQTCCSFTILRDSAESYDYATAEAESQKREATGAAEVKAKEFAEQDEEAKKDNALGRHGQEMLEAALALEQTLQGPAMSEFFRSVRTEGCVLHD